MAEPAHSSIAAVVTALDHPTRRRIVAVLYAGEQHVSALARMLGVSRPVVHVHLAKLASAGLVRSRLDLSEDGKALRVVELESFDIRLTPETVTAEAEREASHQEEGH